MYRKIGIIGLGLIGGSLAKAFRSRARTPEIVAYNRNEDVCKIALEEHVIDGYTLQIDETFVGCEVIFICTPVDTILSFAQKLLPYIGRDCILSDVGSTKGHIYDGMRQYHRQFYYIGGHPMTGSEKFRYQASKEHLFENAYYIITPDASVPEETTENFKKAIASLGAIPVQMPPHKHDYIVASISHVPHIIAASLCRNVEKLDTDQKYMKLLAAGGFKDITRIASSSPNMWESICLDNKSEILKVLDSLEEVIISFRQSLLEKDGSEIFHFFDTARQYRDSFSNITPGSFIKRYEIVVDVLDKPGSIAIIAVLFSSNNINIKNISIIHNREGESGVINISFDSEKQRNDAVALLEQMNYEVYKKD